MQIDDIIKESLQGIIIVDELEKEERKKIRLLSRATRTWEKLAMDSINNKLGNC